MRHVGAALLAALLYLGAGASAEAEEAERPRPRKQTRLQVVVLVEPVEGVSGKVADRLSRRIQRLLKKNRSLKVVSASRQLEVFAGEIPTDAIEEAKKALQKALELLESGSHKQAIAAFSQARLLQGKVLNHVKKADLALGQLGQAIAYFHNRLHDLSHRTLVDLFSWRPTLKVDTSSLPKPFLALVDRAKREAKKGPRGTLVVQTRPAGASAFLNGQSVGKTPLELDGVPVGTHYLTLRKTGYFKLTMALKVPTPGKVEYAYALKQNEKYLLLEQALKRSWPDFGKARATAAMEELKTLLGVDQIVLVRPAPPSEAGVKTESCLYDLRTGNLLKRLTGTLPLKGKGGEEYAQNLYIGVRADGTLPDPGAEKVDTGPGRKPIWKRWWFWTAVGAAAVAAVTGIAVPLSMRDKGPDIPGGYQGVSIRF